jgi:hypothetical protein
LQRLFEPPQPRECVRRYLSIDAAFCDRMSTDWRRHQEQCLPGIEQHLESDQLYLEKRDPVFQGK